MNVLVLGAGLSGVAVANYCTSREGYNVTITDAKKETPFMQQLDPSVRNALGKQGFDLLEDVHLVITSSGFPPDAKLPQEAKARDIPVQSELEFSLHDYKGVVLAITGTNGKSTTTKMLEHLLVDNGVKAEACGNIGLTVSEILMRPQIPDVLCLEVSSYQLSSSQKLSFDGGAFLNFSEDHLGYHGNLKNYFESKMRITTFSDGPVLVYKNFAEDCKEYGLRLPPHCKKVTPQVWSDEFADHDQRNASVAFALAQIVKPISTEKAQEAFSSYTSLPHRFERFISSSGHTYINDSKATNLDAVLVALNSVSEPVQLLLGGQGKGESFRGLLERKDKISRLICFGEMGTHLMKELSELENKQIYPNLREALQDMKSWHDGQSTTLLSPGGASFDEFKNFEERGDFFVKTIQKGGVSL